MLSLLNPGEMCVIPKGVEHKPTCNQVCEVVLMELSDTINMGSEALDASLLACERVGER